MDVEDVSLTEVMNLLEAEPLSGSEGGVIPELTSPGPDVPALILLVSTGKEEEAKKEYKHAPQKIKKLDCEKQLRKYYQLCSG